MREIRCGGKTATVRVEDLRVACVNIRSSHNVGSIFRTADALGVEKMYLCGITPQPGGTGPSASLRASKDLAKTALGAEQTVPWERGRRAGDVLRKLRTQGFQIVGLEQDTCSRDIFSFTPKKKVLLVLGEEVKGLPAALRRQCGTILEIPMLGKKESLNVSVAFGIAGYLLKFKIK